jgi:hypothetical protein
MSPKVFTDQRPVLLAVPIDPCDLSSDIRIAVADVVLTPVLRVARATPALARALRFVVERESVNRLEAPAVVTPLGRGED